MSLVAARLPPLLFVAVVALLAVGLVGGGGVEQPRRTTTPWHRLQGYTPEDYAREFGRKYRSFGMASPRMPQIGEYCDFLGGVA
jgi:hypothetical protein